MQGGTGLRFRVTLVAILPVVTLLFVLGFLAYQQYSQDSFTKRVEQATALLESFAISSSVAVATQNLEGLDADMIRMAQVGGRLHGLVHVGMLDHRGRILAQAYARDEDDVIMTIPREIPDQKFYEETVRTKKGIWKTLVQSDGVPLLAISVPTVSGLRWGTLVGYFEMATFEDRMAQVMLNVLYATCLITLTMTLGLLFGLFRIVIRPVRALARAAARVRGGDLSTRVSIGSTDEIGMLGDSFNRMTRELSGYTTELQKRVEERTQELHDKNQQLEEVNLQLGDAVKKLDELAKTDRLTNVSNRGHIIDLFEEGLAMTIRRNGTFSILLFDVDHFKSFNDTHGHLVGDFVLKEGVKRVQNALRGMDRLGRYGGEEFLVLLPSTDGTGATAVGENVRECIGRGEFVSPDGESVGHVTVSGGVATYPEDGETVPELIKVADSRLYRAKAQGRNRIVA